MHAALLKKMLHLPINQVNYWQHQPSATMKIAIIGAGSIGSHLARYLSGEHMDIVIVDKNPEKLFMLNTEHNLMTVEGDGTKLNVLKKAEAGNCDLFLAVTDVAERNMVACSIAKEMGAGITVARVNRLDYLLDNYRHSLHRMGVDHAIFPEQLVAQNIIDSLSHAWVSNWLEFNHGQLIMLGVRLADEAPLAGKYLRELNDAHQSMHVAAIRRDYDTLIPRGDRQLLPGDMLYVTTTTSGLPQVAKLTGKQIYTVKHAVMAGCGPIAEMVLDGVPRQLRFSIVENDIDQVRQLIRRHPGCELIHGEPSEIGYVKFYDIDDGVKMVVNVDKLRNDIDYTTKIYQCTDAKCTNPDTCCMETTMSLEMPLTRKNKKSPTLQETFIIKNINTNHLQGATIFFERDKGYRAAWGFLD